MSKINAPDIEPAPEEPVLDAASVASSTSAPRPVPSRGKRIDFAPRRSKPVPKPIVPKPVTRPAPTPVVERHTTVVVVPPRQKPVSSGFVAMEPDLDNFVEDESAPIEEAQEDFLAEDDPDDYVEEVLSQVSESRTETTVRRSPFLKNYTIEKRPLSSRVPVREQVASAEDLAPTPREEFEEEEFIKRTDSVPENAEEPVVTPTEKTGSKIGAAITILITIILGAGVGVFVYLAFFQ